MDLKALLQPISGDRPCGPDLNSEFDAEYEEYYFSAVSRLPDFFFQPGVERPDKSKTADRYFDPKSVDYRDEERAIGVLLTRTRDIRLLTLLAQWEILSGRLVPMVEAIEMIAELLQHFPDALHPNLDNGASDRRDALEELNQPATITQPLMFMGLTGPTSEISLRRIRVASGQGTPLDNEHDLDGPGMMSELGATANRQEVDKSFAYVSRILTALHSIEQSCKSNGKAPFTPDFSNLTTVLTEIIEIIKTARPDLGKSPPPASATDLSSEAGDGAPENSNDFNQISPSSGKPVDLSGGPTIISHDYARRVLEACESYFCRQQPSSATLLLVTQARLLIGKPLVEAIRTLLPAQASAARVDFGPQTGFFIDAERLFQLTNEASNQQHSADPTAALSVPEFTVNSSETALLAILSVEDYFLRTERSSPVPILLQRARAYLSMDFQTLIDELIPDTSVSE